MRKKRPETYSLRCLIRLTFVCLLSQLPIDIRAYCPVRVRLLCLSSRS